MNIVMLGGKLIQRARAPRTYRDMIAAMRQSQRHAASYA
jgi:hypothetical protein